MFFWYIFQICPNIGDEIQPPIYAKDGLWSSQANLGPFRISTDQNTHSIHVFYLHLS